MGRYAMGGWTTEGAGSEMIASRCTEVGEMGPVA